jgi:hypothetical protein
MANDFFVPQIDYRSRDYSSIRDDMLNLISNFAPQWTSRDATDFGVVLIELFSYMGDILNYYIDRAANEGFLSTATQRETVLGIARMLNYSPASPTPAKFNLLATNVSTVTATVAPSTTAPALFSTSTDADGNQVFYEYLGASNIVIGAGSSATIPVSEGQTVVKNAYKVSDGTPYQTYSLPDIPIIASSISLDVSGDAYTNVNNLIDYGPADKVFTTFYDGNNQSYIKFGEGVSGVIPPSGGVINVIYRKGGGTAGNVAANQITNVVTNSLVSKLSVTNTTTATAAGTDFESTDSIRTNAPLQLSALNRAVSLNDYAKLAVKLTDPVVQKAIAVAETYNSIILFVAGPSGGHITSQSDINKISASFVSKAPPGTSITVADYTEAYPAVSLTVYVAPTANATNVAADVKAALKDLFAFDNVTFNDTISKGDVYKTVISVANVVGCDITYFEKQYIAAAPATLNETLYFYINEIPTYNSTYSVTVATSGGLAT